MKTIDRAHERDRRRDWIIILLILLLGFVCIILASGWALRFTPRWELDANAQSLIDPNSSFLTNKPEGFFEPIDPAILTNVNWLNVYLTPGAALPVITQPFTSTSATASLTLPATGTLISTQTLSPPTPVSPTNTPTVLPSATRTFAVIPPTSTRTMEPAPPPASTSTDIPTATMTFTPAFTSTFTPTNIPSAFCATIINITGASGSFQKPSGSVCFQYTDSSFANGGIFQITSTVAAGANGKVDGSICPQVTLPDGVPVSYGVAQSGGAMVFRITGDQDIVNITVSDWTTYPTCP